MAPLSLLTAHLDIRVMILEQLLVSEEYIKPRFSNYSTNPTTPNLTMLSLTCKQLREEARVVFFGKNIFLFERVGSRYKSRGPAPFHPMFLTSFGGSETKKLMQKVAFEFVPKTGWYPTGGPGSGDKYMIDGPWFNQDEFRHALNILPLLPNVREIELVINVPSSVQLCKYHFNRLSETHKSICSSHINTGCEKDACDAAGIPPALRADQPSYLDRAETVLKAFKIRKNVKIEWQVFEWDQTRNDIYETLDERFVPLKESRCDWGSFSFLREFCERTNDGYKTEERKSWLESLGESRISRKKALTW